MDFIVAFSIGYTICYILTTVISRIRAAGVLRVVTADEDGPYLFLELSRNVGDVSRKKYVLLKISNQYVDSQN